MRYVDNLRRLLSGMKQAKGCFTSMVKAGQTYYSRQFIKIDGFLTDQESRPRNIMNPSQSLCGMLCCLQTVFWNPIKRVFPSFIQGMTKKQINNMVKSKVKPGWKAVCIDGSAFDSTQNATMMQLLDTSFFKLITPSLRHLLTLCKQKYKQHFTIDVEDLLKIILDQATDLNNICFTEVPGIRRVHWPQQIYKIFQSNYPHKCIGRDREWIQTHYVVNVIRGTTFSGHPTKTTLGNTLRSIAYAYYYLTKAGISTPWQRDDVYVIAAGDDVVIFCDPKHVRKIKQSIELNTSRFKGTESQFGLQGVACGLGQCVKTVLVVQWYEFDFCSKWTFGCTQQDFTTTRDMMKLMTTKLYYTKENSDILSHPVLHAKAILVGLESQHVSHLLQDMLKVRVSLCEQRYGRADDRNIDYTRLCSKLKNSFNDQDSQYLAQHAVNYRLGVDLKSLIDLFESGTLGFNVGETVSEPVDPPIL